MDRTGRLEMLLQYSERLPPLPQRFQADSDRELHRIAECQTPVFLWVEIAEGVVHFGADIPRESPTVRGFVSLLLAALDGKPATQVAELPDDLLDRLRLTEALGMTRTQGLSAVVRRLKAMVAVQGRSIGTPTELPHSVQDPS